MRIGFLGFGKSNRSLLKYLLKHQEAKFFVSEAKTLDGETKKFLEEHSVEYEEGGHTEKLL
ncbi:MAG TPA: UDP-N-acetylmuramoyl-L-alanine--D-glutamate ligase, partial [Thermotoga sp.]|nr:UDP-N-acetylmuramoyl-L-alanine--D-glutamate ligase [Thermotoga sp.]